MFSSFVINWYSLNIIKTVPMNMCMYVHRMITDVFQLHERQARHRSIREDSHFFRSSLAIELQCLKRAR